ncbi:hypothetical protein F4780DRAFT_80575 [Xylariomycetidae sp. FL0641]|nr:hypothetical protein F4780DRAFT_80575 [Xylariomycetidae sp. FL0641]
MRSRSPDLEMPRVEGELFSPTETRRPTSPIFNHGLTSVELQMAQAKQYIGISDNHQPSSSPTSGKVYEFSPVFRPEELSPQFSDSSEYEVDVEDKKSSLWASPPQSPSFERQPRINAQYGASTNRYSMFTTVTIDVEQYESPGSISSGPDNQDQLVPDCADDGWLDQLRDLNLFNDVDEYINAWDEFRKRQKEIGQQKRLRRIRSWSVSKRTSSERGSDSDKEDFLPWCENDESGPNARRTRRKTNRYSMDLQIQEPIQEQKEPDDEILLPPGALFAELPYFTGNMDFDDS